MSVTIQLRRDTAANWTSVNPILNQGEVGVETDTNKAKFGDGTTHWSSLPYWSPGGSAVSSVFGRVGAVTAQTGDYTASQVGADASGAAAAAQAAAQSYADTNKLAKSANLSDVASASTSRTNLGLGSAALLASAAVAQTANNLSDLASASSARTNLGLGTAAVAAIDTTAADFQADGVAAAGSTGKVADAGHVHPFKPWQFHVAAYGAKGDGKVVTDGAMTNGSPNLACTTSTPFVSGDVGKHILVSTAAGSFAHLHSTISTFTNSGHVVLANNATATTAGTPGAITYYGTDDTTAIQNCINAAVTYAQANNGYAEVLFDDAIYIIAGAFQLGGATLGNFQIGLPNISASSGVKVVLALTGAMKTAPLMHWLQVTPQAHGTILASVRTDGTNDATYGPATVIGGPVSGFGGEPGTFSNALIRVEGIGTLLPYNATMSGVDLFGMVEAHVPSYSCMVAAVVPTSTAPTPSLATVSNISNQWAYGIRFPATGNQVVCLGGVIAVEGMCYGIGVSEWTHLQDGHAMYCIGGIGLFSGNGVSMAHHAVIDHMQVENSTNAIIQVDNGTKRILCTSLGIESVSGTNIVFDPGNRIVGTVGVLAANSSGSYQTGGWAGGHGLNIVFINQMSTGGFVGPPSVPATATAFFNYYYRDATVFLTAAGGAVTAIAIDGTATGLTLGTSGTVAIRVPSGHSITLTYASTAPTWQWVLD